MAAGSELIDAELQKQLRESWSKAEYVLQECCDVFGEFPTALRSEEAAEGVKTVAKLWERSQLEDLQEETTEVKAEGEPKGASLRQHHYGICKETNDRKGL